MSAFSLMSFNIGGYSINNETLRRWEKRAPLCGEILLQYQPDLICFQEVEPENREFLHKRLFQYDFECGEKTINSEENLAVYNPIYWKKERMKKIDAGIFFLSPTPEVWSKGWDAMHIRGANWVLLECIETKVVFLLLNTHLDHRGVQARIESSQLIVNKIGNLRRAGDYPVIIAGDFNSRAWAPMNENVTDYPPPVLPPYLPFGPAVHRIYTDHKYKDAYLVSGNPNQVDMNTYHDYYGNDFPPCALRIDWVLLLDGIRSFHCKSYSLIRYAQPPIYPSDHFPILTELEWCKL